MGLCQIGLLVGQLSLEFVRECLDFALLLLESSEALLQEPGETT